jgi:hypothetical protein
MRANRVLRAALLPAVLGLAVLGTLVAVVLVSGSVGGEGVPPPAPPFVRPPGGSISAVDVKQRTGDALTVVRQTVSGTAEETLTIPAGATVERLRLIEAGEVEPGDWLTVIGIPDPVKNFAIHSMVVIPGGGTLEADGAARSAAGFAGHEVARDPRDRPILGGQVIRVEENVIYLEGPTGEIAVTAGPEAPAKLYRFEAATPDAVEEGDRLAADFGAAAIARVLILPGGAAG